MKRERTHTLLAEFVAALALLSIVAWLNWRRNARMQETAEWVIHTERVRDELDRLLMQMQDIETGARGFVVTGDPAFLEPFEAVRGKVNTQFHAVRTLTRDNPRQQANCDALEPLIARRVALAHFFAAEARERAITLKPNNPWLQSEAGSES